MYTQYIENKDTIGLDFTLTQLSFADSGVLTQDTKSISIRYLPKTTYLPTYPIILWSELLPNRYLRSHRVRPVLTT